MDKTMEQQARTALSKLTTVEKVYNTEVLGSRFYADVEIAQDGRHKIWWRETDKVFVRRARGSSSPLSKPNIEVK